MEININNKLYFVNEDEFTQTKHEEYHTLILRDGVGEMDREIGLISQLILDEQAYDFIHVGATHGGYTALQLLPYFTSIYIINPNNDDNVKKNCEKYDIGKVNTTSVNNKRFKIIKYEGNYHHFDFIAIICTYQPINLPLHACYSLNFSKLLIYVPYCLNVGFKNKTFIDGNIIRYNNLLHLCMIVKDASDGFRDILTKNLPWVDQWTILDTGSTDNTQLIIKETMSKNGKLFCEPFINFPDSRNRCLTLAREHNYCRYLIMLDDTYVLKGDIDEFLSVLRCDQFADSYNVFVHSNDIQYGSNRLLIATRDLNYKYKIHEIIDGNRNVVVQCPKDRIYIEDIDSDYMKERTRNRKEQDLVLLHDTLLEMPNDPRTLTYLVQTYCELSRWDDAFHYAELRVVLAGYREEITECYLIMGNILESVRGANFDVCKDMYVKCYEHDPLRPDAAYCIGNMYYMIDDYENAYEWLLKGYNVGTPMHVTSNLRPKIYNELLPYRMVEVCDKVQDYKSGIHAAQRYLKHQYDHTIKSYLDIFNVLMQDINIGDLKIKNDEVNIGGVNLKINNNCICFVADGGFGCWNGHSIKKGGIGGSETYIIEMAKQMKNLTTKHVYIFCNTDTEEVIDGVIYKKIIHYLPFLHQHIVDVCIISRYSEYIHVTLKHDVKKVFLVVHDLTMTGNIIPIDDRIAGIFCMSKWHKLYFTTLFPTLNNVHIFPNGIHYEKKDITNKRKNSFIYSSFPNRGLVHLLRMFGGVRKLLEGATLDVFCDMSNEWCWQVSHDEMEEINGLLEKHKKYVTNHGFVKKEVLYQCMVTSEVMLYPCTFRETFCISILEAKMHGVICVTNDLAALNDWDNIMVDGDASTQEWQAKAIMKVVDVLGNNNDKYIQDQINMVKRYDWNTLGKEMVNYINNKIDVVGEIDGVDIINNNESEGDVVLINDKLNYCDMYNWTNDLPRSSKGIMLSILDLYKDKKCKVLEIGTFAGTSIIGFLDYLPYATGTVIDLWEDYDESDVVKTIKKDKVEQIFYNNVKISGLSDRIKCIKGDSKDVLIRLIGNNKKYDLIYVDGSHHGFDCYTDMVLSWKLLNTDGVLIIDDYLWKPDKETPFTPYEAINYFMLTYKNKYKVLGIGYRVFLKKI